MNIFGDCNVVCFVLQLRGFLCVKKKVVVVVVKKISVAQ